MNARLHAHSILLTLLGSCPAVLCHAQSDDRLVPLHMFFSEPAGDNATITLEPGAVIEARSRYSGQVGYLFNPRHTAPVGTVPLYEWFSPSRGDSHTTSLGAWRNDTAEPMRSPDYQRPRLLGYVYDPAQPQPPDTVPLIKWFSPGREDNFTTTSAAWRAREGEARSPDYVFSQLEGYIPPPPGMAPAPLPAPVARRDVEVTLDRIVVHEDCDNITAGDWFVGIQAVQAGNPGDIQANQFPNEREAADVDTGETVAINKQVMLNQVPITNDVAVTVGAIDCDSDSLFSVIGLFPFHEIAWAFSGEKTLDYRGTNGIRLNCSGEEEITEVSGHDDHVGFQSRVFSAAEWQAGGTFTIPVPPTIDRDCMRRDTNISDPGGFRQPNFTATVSVRPALVSVAPGRP